MKRHILNFLAALSLAACVVLQVRSYHRWDFIRFGWTPSGKPDRITIIGCGSSGGRIDFDCYESPRVYTNYLESNSKPATPHFLGLHWQSQRARAPLLWRHFGFNFQRLQSMIPVNADGTIAVASNGFFHATAAGQLPESSCTIAFPTWLPIVPIAAGLAWQLVKLPGGRRRNRIAAGQCLSCGYDLRATPDRCPECGAIPEKPSNLPTSSQIFRRFCIRTVAGWATSLLFALALAAFSSVLICQFLYQNMIGLYPQFLQSWTIFNRYMACIALCALGVISSALVSLLLVDGLRRLRSILPPKN